MIAMGLRCVVGCRASVGHEQSRAPLRCDAGLTGTRSRNAGRTGGTVAPVHRWEAVAGPPPLGYPLPHEQEQCARTNREPENCRCSGYYTQDHEDSHGHSPMTKRHLGYSDSPTINHGHHLLSCGAGRSCGDHSTCRRPLASRWGVTGGLRVMPMIKDP